LALEGMVGHGQSTTQVDTIERLGPDGQYDIALIAVRRDQRGDVREGAVILRRRLVLEG
jgi:hypothetical protein